MRYALWSGALAILAAVGCGSGGADPVSGEAPEMQADQVIYGVEHIVTADGVKRALLEADTAYMYEDSARFDLREVHLIMFTDRGEPRGELTARRGRLDTQTQQMVARGDVVLVTAEEDRTVMTEELHFDPEGDRIWSDVETTLQQDGTTVRGTGFTSDARLRNLRIRGPSGTFEGVELEM